MKNDQNCASTAHQNQQDERAPVRTSPDPKKPAEPKQADRRPDYLQELWHRRAR